MGSIREHISEYNRLHKECDAIYHAAAVRCGLSDCAFWIYYMLLDTDSTLKQSELCDSGSMPRQTVNSALKKLEKEGFIELRSIEGKLGKTVHLTGKGSRFADDNILPVMNAEEKACGAFSQEETEIFLALFRSLVRNLAEEIGTSPEEGDQL